MSAAFSRLFNARHYSVAMSISPEHCISVPLDKAYRLLNHGPTVLVSSAFGGRSNVMAAAWSMPLDFSPPKVTVVIDKATLTRQLVESSGVLALNVPSRAIAAEVLALGSESALTVPDKLDRHGVRTFEASCIDVPLVQGCIAWLECRVLPEPHNQDHYDLFIAEVVAAWADQRVFSDGHWNFDAAPPELRSLHYVAGGQFYVTGESLVMSTPEKF
jgi:flavin reductase (DIM6/NTAB) family NADH-FMN oxidoreductase RutF